MVRFIVVRHGYSQGNKEKRFCGQLDIPLDEAGHRQAAATAQYIVSNFQVDRIYSSHLSRAFLTAKPVADALGLEVIPLRQLQEVDVGRWHNMLISDIIQEEPELFASYKAYPGLFRFPGGESYEETMARAKQVFDEIAAQNEGKTVVVATHGGVIRALCTVWMRIPPDQLQKIPPIPNCSVTIVEYENGTANFLQMGSTDHLSSKTEESGIQ